MREQAGPLVVGASTTIAAHLLPPSALRALSCRAARRRGSSCLRRKHRAGSWTKCAPGRVPLGLVEGHARASGVRLEPFVDDEIIPVVGSRRAVRRSLHAPISTECRSSGAKPGRGRAASWSARSRKAGLGRRAARSLDVELGSTEAIARWGRRRPGARLRLPLVGARTCLRRTRAYRPRARSRGASNLPMGAAGRPAHRDGRALSRLRAAGPGRVKARISAPVWRRTPVSRRRRNGRRVTRGEGPGIAPASIGSIGSWTMSPNAVGPIGWVSRPPPPRGAPAEGRGSYIGRTIRTVARATSALRP